MGNNEQGGGDSEGDGFVLDPAFDAERPTLLIVDDDDDIRCLIRGQLDVIGYDVIEGRDGADALAQLREALRPPAAILTDLSMPRLDGWQFIETIRGDNRWSAIPIIVISASTNPPAGIRCLRKPLVRALLMKALAEVGAGAPSSALP
jgi:two-component system chemotaxis response regulator CheY